MNPSLPIYTYTGQTFWLTNALLPSRLPDVRPVSLASYPNQTQCLACNLTEGWARSHGFPGKFEHKFAQPQFHQKKVISIACPIQCSNLAGSSPRQRAWKICKSREIEKWNYALFCLALPTWNGWIIICIHSVRATWLNKSGCGTYFRPFTEV